MRNSVAVPSKLSHSRSSPWNHTTGHERGSGFERNQKNVAVSAMAHGYIPPGSGHSGCGIGVL